MGLEVVETPDASFSFPSHPIPYLSLPFLPILPPIPSYDIITNFKFGGIKVERKVDQSRI